MATKAGEDLLSLSGVLTECFGKGSDFTVIVEEPSCDSPRSVRNSEAPVKCTEFKVWSVLLAQWSPVCEKMIRSESYAESQAAQVVIKDFSAGAVEIFLRFMHSGTVGRFAIPLVEVVALADKHQVKALHDACLCFVRQELKSRPAVACEVFASADRFLLADSRTEALDRIFMNPGEALRKRPALDPELLEEILGVRLAVHVRVCASKNPPELG
ncbi:bath-42 [Symbiodinium sp. CCMP2592]|nr:bath-42 [Symbiodinium sp. CCMP2592]